MRIKLILSFIRFLFFFKLIECWTSNSLLNGFYQQNLNSHGIKNLKSNHHTLKSTHLNSNVNPDLNKRNSLGGKLNGLLRQKASELNLSPSNNRKNHKPQFVFEEDDDNKVVEQSNRKNKQTSGDKKKKKLKNNKVNKAESQKKTLKSKNNLKKISRDDYEKTSYEKNQEKKNSRKSLKKKPSNEVTTELEFKNSNEDTYETKKGKIKDQIKQKLRERAKERKSLKVLKASLNSTPPPATTEASLLDESPNKEIEIEDQTLEQIQPGFQLLAKKIYKPLYSVNDNQKKILGTKPRKCIKTLKLQTSENDEKKIETSSEKPVMVENLTPSTTQPPPQPSKTTTSTSEQSSSKIIPTINKVTTRQTYRPIYLDFPEPKHLNSRNYNHNDDKVVLLNTKKFSDTKNTNLNDLTNPSNDAEKTLRLSPYTYKNNMNLSPFSAYRHGYNENEKNKKPKNYDKQDYNNDLYSAPKYKEPKYKYDDKKDYKDPQLSNLVIINNNNNNNNDNQDLFGNNSFYDTEELTRFFDDHKDYTLGHLTKMNVASKVLSYFKKDSKDINKYLDEEKTNNLRSITPIYEIIDARKNDSTSEEVINLKSNKATYEFYPRDNGGVIIINNANNNNNNNLISNVKSILSGQANFNNNNAGVSLNLDQDEIDRLLKDAIIINNDNNNNNNNENT